MSQLDLCDITIKDSSSVADLLDLIPELKPIIAEVKQEVLKQYTDLSVRAFKSKVPIKTGELRNEDIASNIRGSSSRIYVLNIPHVNSEQRRKPSASDLAAILDDGSEYGVKLFRRRTSVASARFSPVGRGLPTKGWIDQAFNELIEVLDGQ